MNKWPETISMDAFRETWVLEGEPLWRRVFDAHRDKMQIKSQHIALGNLEKIFTATFTLSNSKGFQAMSLRDLSREAGISMGGLYAYIGSKDDLAGAIAEVLRKAIDDVLSDQSVIDLSPVERLKAMIYGDIFMNEIMRPWYYFCYLEAKGLSQEQRAAAARIELRFDERLLETFTAGVAAQLFVPDRLELQAANTKAMLQQWYLKAWKFASYGTRTEDYAAFVFDMSLRNLAYRPA